ncbi:uncharacterized protein A4U43_C07F37630 [Asparagus officinalis]|uniref:CDP-diacylglycerol--glycerol-3-phosphate 3-phosphatidyltransferase n=1 Tax=Asparagus officinalis TaxID=4686 RepID=A0A5P1EL24_ASPOF|nr:CDP-diacylglycerol--glycerol-3-phosphate 3-phosphatidyltransferase 1, chloroplastic [Asparagus officinalis]ONK65489.1 uncharacterized protein A4U43_C07F37630 [Asparagus officinalis]
MAIIKTLVRSLTRRNRNPRSSIPLFSFSSPHSLSPAFSIASNPSSSSILRLTSSHSGPRFICSPPWMLSQFTTPLYLRGKDAIFPSDLLRVRSFPTELGFIGGDGGLISDGGIERVELDDRFLNLPNLISISRGVSGPFIGWMIINEWYLPAFCGLAISGATDWLDGFLARKMGINSVFGSYLDPLADKVLIASVALAMVKQDLLHPALVGLVVFRDVALVIGAIYKRASSLGWEWKSWSEFVNLDVLHREKVEPLFISKVNTVFQLLLVAGALLQPEFGTEETQLYIKYLSWLVASTTIASSAAYGAQHLRSRSAYAIRKL